MKKLCYNIFMKFKYVAKKIFTIEFILICFGLVTLVFSIFYKNKASRLFKEYELKTVNLILLNSNASPMTAGDTELFSQGLKNDYEPFTYFDFALEEELDKIIELFKDRVGQKDQEKTEQVKEELSALILDFQDKISQKQITLTFGYDSLTYCSSLLLLISILCVVFKTLKQKSQLKNIQLRNDEQNKISRNLHDGVAQDLAALKFYLRQDDKEKSDFYASQALNEVRYLIGALHIDLSKAFDEIIKQMLQTFESNYKIQTETLIASTHINTLPQTVQIEIIRILQESLSNIARHANASKVTVKFTDVGQDFKMTISDNGVGFDLEKVEELNKSDSKKHYGVQNIIDRIQALGGSVEFINKEGTTIAITIKNIIY